MKPLLIFSIISFVILSGCTFRAVENENPEVPSPTPESTGGVPPPSVYSTPSYTTPYETPYTTPYSTPYVTPYSSPYNTPTTPPQAPQEGPKTYNVDITQGVGVAEGAG